MNSTQKAYQDKARGILRAEINRRDLSYTDLAEKLAAIGVKETGRNLSNKIARGGFTAGFFVQCLIAIGCHVVRLEEAP
jgi:hypothetical protein